MQPALPRFAPLPAQASWQAIDFISDLHLHASEPATLAALADFLARSSAQAVFILGDLFDVWVGDDAPQGTDADAAFERACLDLLRQAAPRQQLHFMVGNRDFLFGPQAAEQACLHLLDDPTVLHFGGQRWLLSHGDALCLQDAEYLRFRAQVRSPQWQKDFLAQPLPQRRAIARSLRAQSEARKQAGSQPYADVDADLARQWLRAAQATALIHGHTHRPAEHALGAGLRRIVLSDWEPLAQPARLQALRLEQTGPGAPPQIRRWSLR
jgi:UDP-2,3-diacylglucosamine hydrolase